MMLAFDLRAPACRRDLVELRLRPDIGQPTTILLTRADLRRFTTELSLQAEIAVPATCALLQTTRMTIDNE
jgi:hypothetical protein